MNRIRSAGALAAAMAGRAAPALASVDGLKVSARGMESPSTKEMNDSFILRFGRGLRKRQGERTARRAPARLALHAASLGSDPSWAARSAGADARYQAPTLGIELHGSAAASDPPFCSSSIEIPSGERTNAMRPSRGGRLMVTPPSIRRWQVA